MKKFYLFSLSLLFSFFFTQVFSQTDPAQPNILLIIADDMGTDATNGYENTGIMPVTPNIDALRSSGLTFMNAWAAPKCTPSRAAIFSGKYGVKTGVTDTPGNLEQSETSLFEALAAQTGNAYADALIGKWHLSSPQNVGQVVGHGVDFFEGFLDAQVPDYFDWQMIDHLGTTTNVTDYATSFLTDRAISWVNAQNQPWFMVMSHPAPHSPFHAPPSNLTTRTVNDNSSNRVRFVGAIEAMDTEIGRLLNNLPDPVLDNTLVIFVGDNGSPNGVLRVFPSQHGKNTMYEGGVNVPLIVSGAGVTRAGEAETAMVHVADIFSTILEVTGASFPGGIHNSLSFHHLLSGSSGATRPFNYSELGTDNNADWTITDGRYKLISLAEGVQEFYDLQTDPYETNNLIAGLSVAEQAARVALDEEANQIRAHWSCNDLIQNGDEGFIDDCPVTDP
ncbi:MAG: sulfatase-like hydrolase/transferase, partial [Bacteroidota bacterium]